MLFKVFATNRFFALEERKCLFLLLLWKNRAVDRNGCSGFVEINIRYRNKWLSVGMFSEEMRYCLVQYGMHPAGAKRVLLHRGGIMGLLPWEGRVPYHPPLLRHRRECALQIVLSHQIPFLAICFAAQWTQQ